MDMNDIALMMYSLHTLTEKDFLGTLPKAAEVGYRDIQLTGVFNTEASVLKAALDANGLTARSAHQRFASLQEDFDKWVKYYHTIGCTSLMTVGVPEEYRKDADSWKRAAADINTMGKKLKAEGFRFGYQNHDFELAPLGDRNALEILIEETDPDLFFIELEAYWLFYCDVDPAAFVRRYPGRFDIIHIKDMKEPHSKDNTELGTGVIDLPSLVKACKSVGGTKIFAVKQENYTMPPLESVKISLEYLKKLNV
jgi:sugar phosphate isomerase/epimerase